MHFLQKLEIFCNCFSILFVLSCFSVFPIVQIVQGSCFDYKPCNVIILPINTWLIINGSCEIAQIFLSIINIIMKNYIIYHILNIVYLFNFSWLVVGAVIFFRDCNGLSTSDNILFYCTFIYGYVIVCGSANQNLKNAKDFREENNNETQYINI